MKMNQIQALSSTQEDEDVLISIMDTMSIADVDHMPARLRLTRHGCLCIVLYYIYFITNNKSSQKASTATPGIHFLRFQAICS